MNTFDIAVVGGGAAGLSAALVLARTGRPVVVIDDGKPRNAPAAHMQGFLSRDGLPPSELLAIGRREVSSYGAQLITGTVATVAASPDGFDVALSDGTRLNARRVLITTGLVDKVPDVPGVAERWGRDVLHCPYCHGHEVRDQPLGVLGGTPGAVQHALLIRQWSSDVIYFPNTSETTEAELEQLAARDIQVVSGQVDRLVVDGDALSGVALADGTVVPRSAVFVRPAFAGNHALLEQVGARTDDADWPAVDATGLTSVPGVWVAGNAVNPRAQVIAAAGEGSAAAIAINNDLTDEDTSHAVANYRARHHA